MYFILNKIVCNFVVSRKLRGKISNGRCSYDGFAGDHPRMFSHVLVSIYSNKAEPHFRLTKKNGNPKKLAPTIPKITEHATLKEVNTLEQKK